MATKHPWISLLCLEHTPTCLIEAKRFGTKVPQQSLIA